MNKPSISPPRPGQLTSKVIQSLGAAQLTQNLVLPSYVLTVEETLHILRFKHGILGPFDVHSLITEHIPRLEEDGLD